MGFYPDSYLDIIAHMGLSPVLFTKKAPCQAHAVMTVLLMLVFQPIALESAMVSAEEVGDVVETEHLRKTLLTDKDFSA
jgi:hypothetical protein